MYVVWRHCRNKCFLNIWQNFELAVKPYLFFFSSLLYSYMERFKSLNCIAYQMKSSTSSLTLSGNSTEQTERGIQLKCWKTFRKESDVIPCWAGLPRLPLGQHAPQIAGQETAGRMRLIPTPWMPRLCDRWGWSFTQNILSGWSVFAFFLTFGCSNIRVKIEKGEALGFLGVFQSAAFHVSGCAVFSVFILERNENQKTLY